jgi:hypothetical protein
MVATKLGPRSLSTTQPFPLLGGRHRGGIGMRDTESLGFMPARPISIDGWRVPVVRGHTEHQRRHRVPVGE